MTGRSFQAGGLWLMRAALAVLAVSMSGPAVSQTVSSVTEVSYDAALRPLCTAVRMNPAAFGNAPGDAFTLGAAGADGPDRITRQVYDAAGQVVTVQKAYGTPLQQDYATYTWSVDGKQTSLTDANGNLATMAYDGFDRQASWTFPSPTSAGQVNPNDYEAYGYDANGNRVSLRKRDGRTIAYAYDALNRVTAKTYPNGGARPVYYSYDSEGHLTAARFDAASGGDAVTHSYDALGRLSAAGIAMAGVSRTLGYQYDPADDRTRITHPDGVSFGMSYDALDRMANASWTTAAGTTPFLSIGYDAQGRRSDVRRALSDTGYAYDPVGRLASLNQRFAGTNGNVTSGFSYNPASQITSETRDNDAYAWTGAVNVDRAYVANGLNQYSNAGAAAFGYDANGNLTSDGTTGYVYDVENRLVSTSAGASLVYDPLGRLYQTSGGAAGVTQFLYDGDALVAEYDGSTGALLRRYMHGPGVDEPILWDEGGALNCSGTKVLHPDHEGSIIAVADCNGSLTAIDSYDEYGIPGAGNSGRFQYTGQIWIAELGMYYYKARVYSPTLGRFMQTEPIGYKDQNNLYEYVADDPVDNRDSSGENITEIGFLVYDGVQAVSDVVHGAPASTLLNDAVNIGLDVAPIPGLREVKGAVEVGRAVEHGVEAVRAERGAVKEVGNYRHTFEGSKTYDGKGTRSRAGQSAREVSTKNNDPHVSTKFTPAANSREAFKQESRGIQERGGPKSDKNYNRIDSPGTKMRKQDRED